MAFNINGFANLFRIRDIVCLIPTCVYNFYIFVLFYYCNYSIKLPIKDLPIYIILNLILFYILHYFIKLVNFSCTRVRIRTSPFLFFAHKISEQCLSISPFFIFMYYCINLSKRNRKIGHRCLKREQSDSQNFSRNNISIQNPSTGCFVLFLTLFTFINNKKIERNFR